MIKATAWGFKADQDANNILGIRKPGPDAPRLIRLSIDASSLRGGGDGDLHGLGISFGRHLT